MGEDILVRYDTVHKPYHKGDSLESTIPLTLGTKAACSDQITGITTYKQQEAHSFVWYWHTMSYPIANPAGTRRNDNVIITFNDVVIMTL